MEALSQGDNVYDKVIKLTDQLKDLWLEIPMFLAGISAAIIRMGARLMRTSAYVQQSPYLRRKRDTEE